LFSIGIIQKSVLIILIGDNLHEHFVRILKTTFLKFCYKLNYFKEQPKWTETKLSQLERMVTVILIETKPNQIML